MTIWKRQIRDTQTDEIPATPGNTKLDVEEVRSPALSRSDGAVSGYDEIGCEEYAAQAF